MACFFRKDNVSLSYLHTDYLVRLPGSYWVAADGLTIHIHPFGGVNPNWALFEAAIQPHIFQPESAGMGFIRVSGLVMEHCANGFLRTGVGALFHNGWT